MYVFYRLTGLQFSFCEILSFIQAKYYYMYRDIFQIRFNITLQEKVKVQRQTNLPALSHRWKWENNNHWIVPWTYFRLSLIVQDSVKRNEEQGETFSKLSELRVSQDAEAGKMSDICAAALTNWPEILRLSTSWDKLGLQQDNTAKHGTLMRSN